MDKIFTFTDLHDNTDAVAAEVIPLCKTSTENIEDWLSNASTGTKATATELAAEWDELNS
jgi:hypothetical protein